MMRITSPPDRSTRAKLTALVDALEAQLAASRATAANLFSALLAELTAAFSIICMAQ